VELVVPYFQVLLRYLKEENN